MNRNVQKYDPEDDTHIALPYFRCRILEFDHEGTYKISKPKRKDRTGTWVEYWQVEQRFFRDEKGLSDCVFYLNEKAQRIINLNAQKQAVNLTRTVDDKKDRKEFKSWVEGRFEYLLSTYKEDDTTIYAGKSEHLENTQRPFYLWVPSFLAKRDMDEELSIYKEKKQSLNVQW